MPRITISYRRDDSMDIAGRIFDRLALHFGREAVFRDIDNIPAGVDFRRHLETVLETSDIILAIVGPRWVGRSARENRLANVADPVRVEIETALRSGKPLIPVLVSRAVMPSPEQVPESLRDFVYRHAMEVDSGQDFDHHVERLTRTMESILEERRQAEEERQGAETVRKAEEGRQKAEVARRAEEPQQAAEARKGEEEGRPPAAQLKTQENDLVPTAALKAGEKSLAAGTKRLRPWIYVISSIVLTGLVLWQLLPGILWTRDPPIVMERSLVVTGNGGATAIGIAAPNDRNYPAERLTVAVAELPSNGKVVLGDGRTVAIADRALTVAQLTGLMFVPNQVFSAQARCLPMSSKTPPG